MRHDVGLAGRARGARCRTAPATCARVRELVELRLREADRERLDRPRAEPRHRAPRPRSSRCRRSGTRRPARRSPGAARTDSSSSSRSCSTSSPSVGALVRLELRRPSSARCAAGGRARAIGACAPARASSTPVDDALRRRRDQEREQVADRVPVERAARRRGSCRIGFSSEAKISSPSARRSRAA